MGSGQKVGDRRMIVPVLPSGGAGMRDGEVIITRRPRRDGPCCRDRANAAVRVCRSARPTAERRLGDGPNLAAHRASEVPHIVGGEHDGAARGAALRAGNDGRNGHRGPGARVRDLRDRSTEPSNRTCHRWGLALAILGGQSRCRCTKAHRSAIYTPVTGAISADSPSFYRTITART